MVNLSPVPEIQILTFSVVSLDAVILNNIVQTFGMLDLVKKSWQATSARLIAPEI